MPESASDALRRGARRADEGRGRAVLGSGARLAGRWVGCQDETGLSKTPGPVPVQQRTLCLELSEESDSAVFLPPPWLIPRQQLCPAPRMHIAAIDHNVLFLERVAGRHLPYIYATVVLFGLSSWLQFKWFICLWWNVRVPVSQWQRAGRIRTAKGRICQAVMSMRFVLEGLK